MILSDIIDLPEGGLDAVNKALKASFPGIAEGLQVSFCLSCQLRSCSHDAEFTDPALCVRLDCFGQKFDVEMIRLRNNRQQIPVRSISCEMI